MKWPAWFGLGVALGVVGCLLWPRKSVTIPEATAAQIDSLRASRAAYDSLQRAVRDSTTVFLAHTTADSAKVAGLTRSAARSRRLADSLAEVASRYPDPDSGAVVWREAYRARSQEADSLRTANGLQFQAMRGAMATASLCLKAQIDAEGRLNQMQGVQDSLLAAIRRARAPSRVSLALFGGYGAQVSGGRVRTGPQIGVGLAYALKLPKLF